MGKTKNVFRSFIRLVMQKPELYILYIQRRLRLNHRTDCTPSKSHESNISFVSHLYFIRLSECPHCDDRFEFWHAG